MLAIEAAAVAPKVAVVAPADTITDAGTLSEALLLARVTLEPPAGAAAFKVTVQLEPALGFRLAGLQVRDETVGTIRTALVTADTASPSPVASTPTGLIMAIAVVPAVGASVS